MRFLSLLTLASLTALSLTACGGDDDDDSDGGTHESNFKAGISDRMRARYEACAPYIALDFATANCDSNLEGTWKQILSYCIDEKPYEPDPKSDCNLALDEDFTFSGSFTITADQAVETYEEKSIDTVSIELDCVAEGYECTTMDRALNVHGICLEKDNLCVCTETSDIASYTKNWSYDYDEATRELNFTQGDQELRTVTCVQGDKLIMKLLSKDSEGNDAFYIDVFERE